MLCLPVTKMAQIESGAALRPYQFPLQIVQRSRKPFDGGDWIFEIKHDGFRVMAIRDGGPTRLFTRNGYDISAKHLHITGQLNALPAKRFVIDGELVVLDGDGRSNFARLLFGRIGIHYSGVRFALAGELLSANLAAPRTSESVR